MKYIINIFAVCEVVIFFLEEQYLLFHIHIERHNEA